MTIPEIPLEKVSVRKLGCNMRLWCLRLLLHSNKENERFFRPVQVAADTYPSAAHDQEKCNVELPKPNGFHSFFHCKCLLP